MAPPTLRVPSRSFVRRVAFRVMHSVLSRTVLVSAIVVVALGATACSGSFEFSTGQSATDAAVELIEGQEMMQRLNVDPITEASCDEPPIEEVGAVFECRATSGGNQLNFEVEIESEDRIFAGPTNVIDGGDLDAYADSAVDALNEANGFSLPIGSLDCGDRSVVLDADNKMYCLLDDPETNTIFDVEITVRDIDLARFGVEIVAVAE